MLSINGYIKSLFGKMDTTRTKDIHINALRCVPYKTQRDTKDTTKYLINLSKSYICQWLLGVNAFVSSFMNSINWICIVFVSFVSLCVFGKTQLKSLYINGLRYFVSFVLTFVNKEFRNYLNEKFTREITRL
ncbi:hypothetical protein CHQ84_04275 [Francisella noatunensis subsp. orientalis]|uniref:Uncharacterized protein n=1 Tax=Francisella orientalis TaxID=299583 RepID=A0AAP6X9V9_9GAMM|nr:hypothetical protein M973_08580 [Francisella orientalis LADL 07-285A]AKN86098.1 hypothetical protein FNO12_1555 [Francisella orientalis FNO12]AKN87636.1 Hypothetical protein FNO24_1557 [Francisella orientalis FNO24]AKN89174.1 Hypothetical protein FNO190_1555 [Francisella orientalis]AKU05933.1 Hypothetical protein FNO01_1555 [Francisella orientalis]